MLSERVSDQRTGLRRRIAIAATARYSGYTVSFEPNAPPTSGAITLTFDFGRSSASQMSERTSNGICVETQTVRPPSSGTAAHALVSSGTGASLWLTNRPRTTTSAPSSVSESHPSSKECARLEPCSRKIVGAVGPRAIPASVTAGSGS